EHRYDLQLDYTPVDKYIFVYALWLYKLNAQGQPDAASAVRWNLNGEPGAFPDCFQGCPSSPCPLIGYRYSPAMAAALQFQPGSEVYVRLKAVWTRTISPCVPGTPAYAFLNGFAQAPAAPTTDVVMIVNHSEPVTGGSVTPFAF